METVSRRRLPWRLPGLERATAHAAKAGVVRTLAILLSLFLALTALFVVLDVRHLRHTGAYGAAITHIEFQTLALARHAREALRGNDAAIAGLASSRDGLAAELEHLMRGGNRDGVDLPPSPDNIQPLLHKLAERWDGLSQQLKVVLDHRQNLAAVAALTRDLAASERIETAPATAGTGLVASRAQAILRGIQLSLERLRSTDPLDPAAAASLRRQIQMALEMSTSARADTSGLPAGLLDLSERQDVRAQVEGAFAAHQAAVRIANEADAMASESSSLREAYEQMRGDHALYMILVAVSGSMALMTLAVLTRAYNSDAANRAKEAERLRQDADKRNRANQEAILRLMNEIGHIADGNLTVRATVTEDITGAIADSVNYTVEELSVLVRRINDAAARVWSATEAAQRRSGELLAASERQTHEIEGAVASALDMSRAMSGISREALDAAGVARQSLSAADKGAAAATDAIQGMNLIRQHIQDTSKRVKRLGESSQEIGEIVELISDITEQTNVLALNAAIQAASAGEAGKGFSVVAEEVQRLAERSAEATRQIAAIVRTIQGDTQDTVRAMENSTREVVEGARLSDAAGKALGEISVISNSLADLIGDMATSTRAQAAEASAVAEQMREVRHITDQTSAGTQETARSVGELAALAIELKGSVSGFKI